MRHKAISDEAFLSELDPLEPTRLLDEGSDPPAPELLAPEPPAQKPPLQTRAPDQTPLLPEQTRELPVETASTPRLAAIAESAPLSSESARLTHEDYLPSGTELLRGQYRIKRFLGAGGFGITYLAVDSLDREVVIKECFPAALCYRRAGMVLVRRSADQRQFARLVAHFDAEARRLAHLSHPNIVGVHQVFADNGTAYFALDLIRGKNLQAMIGKTAALTPEAIKGLLLTLLDALSYLHDRGILHRDIAPDNILLKSLDDPVLIDFGAARGDSAPGQNRQTALATVKDGYSPPEFYTPGSAETPASDLYSLAATFYHLILGAPPPDALTRLAAVASGAPDPLLPLSDFDRRFDRFFVEALNRALSLNESARPASAAEWALEIHEARRRAAALMKARQDQQIEASISRLVAEAQRQPASAAPPDGTAVSPPEPAPSTAAAMAECQPEQVLAALPPAKPLPRPLPVQFQPQDMRSRKRAATPPAFHAETSTWGRLWLWLIQSRRSR